MTGAHPEKGRFAGDSAPWLRGDAMDDDLPLEIAHAEMDAAVQTGDAIALNLSGGWLMRYCGAWWVLCGIGWLRLTDEATAADIDHVAACLAEVTEDADGSSAEGPELRSPVDSAEE